MNLTRVLNVALPEIPARSMSDRPPRRPPDAVFKEHIEDGKPIVRVLVASQDAMYRFSPQNWALIELFDGKRSYEEIAEMYSRSLGAEYGVEQVREFAGELDSIEFWYKTPQEKNIQLMQKSADERRKLLNSRKSKFGDLSEIAFPAVNPDKFLDWLYRHTSFVYTWWFTLGTLLAFGITFGISLAHWSEIGRDTSEFFNFKDKSWGDVGIFYVLALITLAWHELAHGHACKHYGGRVPAMGFMLVYLTPAFYTDTGEGFVKGTRMVGTPDLCGRDATVVGDDSRLHSKQRRLSTYADDWDCRIAYQLEPIDEARRISHALRDCCHRRSEGIVDSVRVGLGQASHLAVACRRSLCSQTSPPRLCGVCVTFRDL
jgi:putative peptide zinc metalloprotease protein